MLKKRTGWVDRASATLTTQEVEQFQARGKALLEAEKSAPAPEPDNESEEEEDEGDDASALKAKLAALKQQLDEEKKYRRSLEEQLRAAQASAGSGAAQCSLTYAGLSVSAWVHGGPDEATLALLQSAAPLQDPLAVLRHASATPLAPELLKLAAKAARCSSAASAPSGDGEAAAAAEGSDGGKDGTESLSLAALLQACQRQLGGATPPPGAGEPPPSPPAPRKPARSTKFSTGFGEGGDQSALRIMVKHDRLPSELADQQGDIVARIQKSTLAEVKDIKGKLKDKAPVSKKWHPVSGLWELVFELTPEFNDDLVGSESGSQGS